MKIESCFSVLFFLLLAVPSPCFAEEGAGVLEFQAEGSSWGPVRYSRMAAFASQQATISLPVDGTDGKASEDAWAFTASSQQKFYLTTEAPYRFFADLNGDNVCQGGELFPAQEEDGQFHASIPVVAGIDDGTVVLQVRVRFYAHSPKYVYTDFVDSQYLGSASLGGRMTKVAIFLDSPLTQARWVIVADTNGDDELDIEEDGFCSENGFMLHEGNLWVARTTIHGPTAALVFEPSDEPTGFLNVTGESIASVMLNRTRPKEVFMNLPVSATNTFELPVGEYQVMKCMLRDPSSELEYSLWLSNKIFEIDEGATEEEELGGPLDISLSVKEEPLVGLVFLKLGEFKNRSGLQFQAQTVAERPEAPRFEILNSKGTVVASGQFEYG